MYRASSITIVRGFACFLSYSRLGSYVYAMSKVLLGIFIFFGKVFGSAIAL